MDQTTYWTAVGSVGTAAGSIFAFLAIMLTALLYRRQRNDEHAAQVREDMRALVSATGGLIRILSDGSPLISAAWAARTVVQENRPPNSDVDSLRRVLRTGDIGLSIAIVSWERSAEVTAFRDAVASLGVASRRMTGNLNILSNAADMLLAIADDLKMTFVRLLTEPAVLEIFLNQTKEISDSDAFLNALAQHLHGNSAMYFVARYEAAMRSLGGLTTEATMALGELEAHQLVAVARAKSALATSRRTDEMRGHLASLQRYLPSATSERLRQLISDVERDIAKRAASERLGTGAEEPA